MAAWPWKRPRPWWRWECILMITSGTVTNTSALSAVNITIWDRARSGLFVNHGGFSAFMAGNGITRIGTTMPFTMIVTATADMTMTTTGIAIRATTRTTVTVTITTTG